MAAGTCLPPSRLGSDHDGDLDHLPLGGRRCRPARPPVPRAEGGPTLGRCDDSADAGAAGGASQQPQIWPGLPRGVEFNPSDCDLLWHLSAEIGNGSAHRHPFINEFIVPVDDDRGFSCTHPHDIPGVRRDGRATYFFHKRFVEFYNNKNDKTISWQKVGNPRSIILDGTLQGCKEEFVLYAYNMSDNSSQQTEWRLHQYHIRSSVNDEGELVVSKIFHQSQSNLCEMAFKAPAESELTISCGAGQLTSIMSQPCKDILDYAEADDLDHMSLQERYRILLADKSSCPAKVSAEKSVMGEGTSGSTPKRNHDGATCREDICSILQEISSAPPIIESMDDDNSRKLLGEDLSGTQMSSMECFAGSNPNQRPCSSRDSAELQTSQLTYGSEDNQLVVKHGTFLVDVKLEPSLEGDGIDSSVPGCVSKDCEKEMLHHHGDIVENTSEICRSIPAEASSQDKNSYGERLVPYLEVKSELTESDLPGLYENSSTNTAENILDHDGSIAFRSHQRRKRKASMCSTDKAIEEDAQTNVEGIAYSSRRWRRKKTATDSIEKALDEDAPGLLQILMNKGIMVEEIKLYGAGEDDEMLPDCTENNFEDLENVITKLFPKRASLLKLSVARHERGEKAIYCLSCLLSLIEQSRYLKFRDCPVEWGWCRDLQSFIFVFRSHNRIVLERPEYGYATYFFEVVQSLPIEWQLRRLVIAMKLSGCGRTALIENRPLLVGEDLTEGEARVLEEYGWIRNCGLGTMLNYRDRVVHDKWTEKCVADWRTKIGKLLMAGYSEGQMITTHLPKKLGDLLEGTGDVDIDIKLEDPF